ncbi:MAG: LytTR family DNA-binding domain-containing protein [Bacteroidota bacterium]
MKAIIIDDEPRARAVLRTLLEENCPEVEILAEAEDVPEAVKAINKHHPDIIFLDIEMPGYSGFELMDFFSEINFQIIFTTAYSEYAVQAFQVSAIDYLLKPIQIDQLLHAVQKAKEKLNHSQTLEKLEALKSNLNSDGQIKKIALPVANGLLFVETEDIIYLKAEGSYTQIHLVQGPKLLVSRKLKEFEKLLSNPSFFKSHRSYLINLNHVKQYVRQDGGYIVMKNDDVVSIAKDRKDALLEAIKNIG